VVVINEYGQVQRFVEKPKVRGSSAWRTEWQQPAAAAGACSVEQSHAAAAVAASSSNSSLARSLQRGKHGGNNSACGCSSSGSGQ
jgi:hypothetical protein